MRWGPYQTLKPSGVDWLGDVPADWASNRLRFALATNPSSREASHLAPDDEVSFVPMEAVGERGGLDLVATRPAADFAGTYTYFRDDDVVVAKITPCFENGKGAHAAGLVNGAAIGTTELHVLRPHSAALDARFLFYLSISQPFRALGEASMYGAGGQKRVPDTFIKDFRAPLPPLDEQHAIVTFLDRETARIDALVAAKRRLIALLQEKRAALIARAVTRGLDPDVPTKDSGVAWLGQVPAHWEVGHLRRFASVTDCKHYTVTFADDGLPVASVGELSANRFSLKNAKRTTPDEYEFLRAGRVPRRGALLYCRNASVGLVGYIDTDEPFALGQDVCLIGAQDTDGRYLYYQLISRAVTAQLEAKMVGATFNRINVADIKEFEIAWPPPTEQATISRMLDGATVAMERQEQLAYLTIERLDEYRATLITSAVTGRIDVRAAA